MTHPDARESKAHYAAVWRWHFYAGLYVAPFLVLLALSGLVMLAKEPLERWQLGAMQRNVGEGPPISHQARLDAVQTAYFHQAKPLRYQPGRDAGEATRVTLNIGDRPFSVYVDAATGEIRGRVEDSRRIGELAHCVHGTLLMGTWGDRLIEIAASLGILLIGSGLYLWFPGAFRFRWPSRRAGGGPRLAWRGFHRTTGALLAPVLAFYLLSGLAWTGVWGEKLVQGWASLGAAQAPPGGGSPSHHEALNSGSGKVVPWNLEQTPLPSSAPHSHGHAAISLDDAIAAAQQQGIGDRFWVGLPTDHAGVFTVGQTALNGDIEDPTRELLVHLDQHTGAVVGRVSFSDYGAVAKGMAAGVPLHMGSLGPWNLAAAILVCLAVLALAASGLVSWWRRRPAGAGRLGAPPGPVPARVPVGMWVLLALFAMLFPLGGAALVAVALLDWALVSRLPALGRLLS